VSNSQTQTPVSSSQNLAVKLTTVALLKCQISQAKAPARLLELQRAPELLCPPPGTTADLLQQKDGQEAMAPSSVSHLLSCTRLQGNAKFTTCLREIAQLLSALKACSLFPT